jgi:ribosomal protein S7
MVEPNSNKEEEEKKMVDLLANEIPEASTDNAAAIGAVMNLSSGRSNNR